VTRPAPPTGYTTRDNGPVRSGYSVNETHLRGGLSVVLASVTRGTLPRGTLTQVVVFGRARRVTRRTGGTVRLGYNGGVLLKKDGTPVATRVYSPAYLECRLWGYTRLSVLARCPL